MRIVAIIPAKGHSNRLDRKNIHPFRGLPLLCWAIKACKESKYDIDVWVSSDSNEVLDIAFKNGANKYIRPIALCEDHIYKQEAIRDCAKYVKNNDGEADVYISLQPNSPEIKGYHLDMGIDTLLESEKDEIFSVGEDLMQNAAFRIFNGDYVFQKDLSTNCGVVVCELKDVHTKEDLDSIE